VCVKYESNKDPIGLPDKVSTEFGQSAEETISASQGSDEMGPSRSTQIKHKPDKLGS